MKTSDPTTSNGAEHSSGRNGSTGSAKPRRKSASRSSKPSRKAPARKASRAATASNRMEFADYGETASRLFDRSKQALGSAQGWAGDAYAASSKAARSLHMPDMAPASDFFREKPLIVGAVGLGLGVLLGALLPSRSGGGSTAQGKGKSRR